MCGGWGEEEEEERDAPLPHSRMYMHRRNLDLETVPSFLGGKCKCPHRGGCVQGIPNDQRNVTNDNTDADGLMT